MDNTAVKRAPPLIKLPTGTIPPQTDHNDLFDAYFSVIASRSFFLTQIPNVNAAINALEHLILLKPKFLRSHAQRLILLHKNNEPNRFTGAVIDLFLALGHEGQPLKKYFLQLGAGLIPADEYTFLTENLAQALNCQHEWVKQAQGSLLLGQPEATASLLTRTTHLPTPQPINFSAAPTAATTKPLDAVSEANQLIDNGQLDLALDTLEDALLADEHDLASMKFLLQLYVLTGADVRKEIMEEQLKINFGALPAAWISAAGSIT